MHHDIVRAAVGITVLVALSIAAGRHGARPASAAPGDAFVARLARLTTDDRSLAVRLSVPTAGPCRTSPAEPPAIPRAECANDTTRLPPSDLLNLAADVSAAIDSDGDPAALRTAALIDLLWADEAGISLDRSISSLRTAARLAADPAAALADLSAVLLARAGNRQSARDLLDALEVAERAVELAPTNGVALYNRAVALDALLLESQARWAWTEYLAVDSTSVWASAARRRLDRPQPEWPEPVEPRPGSTVAEIRSFIAEWPQAARLYGWDEVLGRWGETVLAGDDDEADRLLDLADAIGAELEGRGGDATLADAVRWIKARSADPGAVAELARAHRAYARGRAAYLDVDDPAADMHFSDAMDAGDAVGGPIRAWAGVFRSATRYYTGRPEAAERMIRTVLKQADSARHPALAARARWVFSTPRFRAGFYEEAWQGYLQSARLFERAGEWENAAAVRALAVNAVYRLGARRVYASAYEALFALSSSRPTVWTHDLLYVLADALAADGMLRAARRVQNEDLDVARSIGQPSYIAEALLARARVLTMHREDSAATRDIGRATRIVDSTDPGPVRDWFEADLRLTRALTSAAPAADAVAAMDSVIGFYSDLDNQIRVLLALIARSEALIALGRTEEAEADFDRVVGQFRDLRATISSARLRAALLDQARQVFDRMIMLQVRADRPVKALWYAEWARESLTAVGASPGTVETSPFAPPPDGAAIEYALVGDTILIWTVAEAGVELTRRQVDRVRLRQLVERTRAALELGADRTAKEGLIALHDLLIAPVRTRVGPVGSPLAIVPDAELHGAPFGAMFDPDRQRFLVDDHPIRMLSSLRDVSELPTPSHPSSISTPPVLLIADPAFEPASNPRLTRLPAALAEIGALAELYPTAIRLTGDAAHRSAFAAAVDSVAVLHFAGHAVFNDERPERSYLVLAPRNGVTRTDGRLAVTDIERMDLDHLRLVVLSACQTLRPVPSRSGGFAGLAQAFLAAGADGVVGSLWRVDDRLTRKLLTEFHRAYRETGHGARALRRAKLQLLRSSDPRLRSPAAWAGFRYAGR